MSYYKKSFLKLLDFTSEEIATHLKVAKNLKAEKKSGVSHRVLEGKNIALVFEKTSTRTRCAFEVAGSDLGMHPVYLDPKSSQIGKKESIEDTARVLGRMFDGIEYRGYGQEIVQKLSDYSGVPVWNGLTNEYHPTQILADLLTIQEHLGELKGKTLVFMGDCRYNMANSLMVGCAKMGMNFVASSNKKYFPNDELTSICKEIAKETGATITFEEDPIKAVKGADVIYTDVWVSMGEDPSVWDERIKDLLPYQVNKTLMESTGKETTKFMHCLPAFHDLKTEIGKDIYDRYGLTAMEVADDVFESEASIVFDEAENRMHTIKAVMLCSLVEDISRWAK